MGVPRSSTDPQPRWVEPPSETGEDRREGGHRAHPFNVYVVHAFTLLLAFTVLILATFTYTRNREAALELVRENFRLEAGSVIGANVNLASRLEGASKSYGTNLIISDTTYGNVHDAFLARPLDRVIVQGRSGSSLIYEILAEAGTGEAKRLAPLVEAFTTAYQLYMDRQWSEALGLFRAVAGDFPDDRPTALYINRCEMLLAYPPGAEWGGISPL